MITGKIWAPPEPGDWRMRPNHLGYVNRAYRKRGIPLARYLALPTGWELVAEKGDLKSFR